RDTSFCFPADTHSVLVKAYLDRIFTDTTGAGAQFRDSLTASAVDPSRIVLITVDSLCERASRRVDSLFQDSTPSAPVYLFRIDTIYAAVQPGTHSYQSVPSTFRGSDFSVRGLLRMPWG